MPRIPNDNDYIFVPTQRRYRWIIVLMSFSTLFVGDGVLHSFGIFLKPLSKEYKQSVNLISIVHALLIGVYLLFKPFVYAFINRFGFQIIGVVGGVLCIIGYMLPSIFPQFPVLVIAMGVFVAIGTSVVCGTSSIVVNFYFEKERAVASGLSSSGSSFGTIFFPTCLYSLETTCGIKRTLLYIGIIMIIPVIASLFYLPLTPVRVLTDIDVEVALVKDCLLKNVEAKRKKNFKREKFKFMGYSFCCCKYSRPKVNKSYPTLYELVSPNRRKVPNLASYIFDPDVLSAHSKKRSWKFFVKSIFLCYLPRGTLMRPMYRDDIFYGGSLMKLPLYKQMVPAEYQMLKSAFYHMSVTRASERNEYEGNVLRGKTKPRKAFTRPLRTIFDLSLLQHCSYQIYLLCTFTFYGGFAIPLTYLYDRGTEKGIDEAICPWLISTVGMGWSVGRISAIGLGTVKSLNFKFYCAVLFLIGGLIVFFSGSDSLMKPSRQFMCCFFFGFCCTTMVLMSSVLIEFYGLENLSNAYGLSVVAMGLGTVGCLITAGFVHDYMGNYNCVFYFSGTCLFMSSICMFCLGFIGVAKKKKRKRSGAAT